MKTIENISMHHAIGVKLKSWIILQIVLQLTT